VDGGSGTRAAAPVDPTVDGGRGTRTAAPVDPTVEGGSGTRAAAAPALAAVPPLLVRVLAEREEAGRASSGYATPAGSGASSYRGVVAPRRLARCGGVVNVSRLAMLEETSSSSDRDDGGDGTRWLGPGLFPAGAFEPAYMLADALPVLARDETLYVFGAGTGRTVGGAGAGTALDPAADGAATEADAGIDGALLLVLGALGITGSISKLPGIGAPCPAFMRVT
jgi:hypothetical protein